MVTLSNLFDTPAITEGNEVFETLFQTEGVHIERIVSHRASSPPDFWYDQDWDEWVVLLKGQASLTLNNGQPVTMTLKSGDHLLIPKKQRHRVESTSADAVWLAIHIHPR